MSLSGIAKFCAPRGVHLEDIPGTDLWAHTEAYSVQEIGGPLWIVKRGTTTDGASVPRLFWRVIGHPMQKDLIFWAVVHDAAYNGHLLRDGQPANLTRLEADDLANRLMTGVLVGGKLRVTGDVKRVTVYRTLRLFGSPNFKGKPG